MNEAALRDYARRHLAPMRDMTGATQYRGAAHLTDGTFLPCVALRDRQPHVELALRRLEETREMLASASLFSRGAARRNHTATIEAFVTGSVVRVEDVAHVEPSPHAIADTLLSKIEGETSMSWTQFVATMRDGRRFSFGSAWSLEFFAMPDAYSAADIIEIEPHKREHADILRERPFFACFLDLR